MPNRLLDSVRSPADLRSMGQDELSRLCAEIRTELIETVSRTGGHLASNLGVVELTVALHRMLDSPADTIVFDVGHQCYVHKLLTGRLESFHTLRTEGGLSGFPRPAESPHDPFLCGHSSTALSSALGIARANTLEGNGRYTAAVVGDGSLGGGMVYEALNNAGRSRDRLIMILNDNKMSISKNVGGIARHLAVIRSRMSYYRFKNFVDHAVRAIPLAGPRLRNWLFRSKSLLKNAIYRSTIFEDMGFAYLGPVDGHDLRALERTLAVAKAMKCPAIIHVHTIKGKGYAHAEKNPKEYHGVPSFDIETGDYAVSENSFSYQFGAYLAELAGQDPRICAVTAAMAQGTGLSLFREKHKPRFFDVGIAEAHAVTFCAGLAKADYLPVFAVYSSFLQRSYDQILHDGALQGRKIVLGVDRAGIVGEDGETHQGVFDAAFLRTIPDVRVFAAADYPHLRRLLRQALYDVPGVAAVRYPRGAAPALPAGYSTEEQEPGRGWLYFGGAPDVPAAPAAIVTYGRTGAAAAQARETLRETGRQVDLFLLSQIHPLPDGLTAALSAYSRVLIFEEGVQSGGVGEHLASALALDGYKGRLFLRAIPDGFIPHASVDSILARLGLDARGIAEACGINPA